MYSNLNEQLLSNNDIFKEKSKTNSLDINIELHNILNNYVINLDIIEESKEPEITIDELTNIERFKILEQYVKLHGIKPSKEERININDEIDLMVSKFNKWYIRALIFTEGDSRDYLGFLQIKSNFINNIYPKFIKDKKINDDRFIQNMLYVISEKTVDDKTLGEKYIFSNLILNMVDIDFNELNELINFKLTNMNGNYICNKCNVINFYFNIKLNSYNLYLYIYDNLINYNLYNLYEIEQLKILYMDKIIPFSVKLDSIIIQNLDP
jgi:hypothetical protein